MSARKWYAHLTSIPFSALTALTASRALATDANGVIITSALTSAQLAAAACAVTDTGRVDLTLSANTLSADLVAGGVRTVDLAGQAGVDAKASGLGGTAGFLTTYTTLVSDTYTPSRTASKVLIIATIQYGHTSGTTTMRISRSGNLIGAELIAATTLTLVLTAVDSPASTSTLTYLLEMKNTTPAGAATQGQLTFIELK